MKEVQKRTIISPAALRLRENEDGTESRILEGYAMKFGVRSRTMGYYWPFQEILEPGCITDEMLREQTIYFTMFHNREMILGRWDKGEGTLRLTIDEIGMKVECEMPDTDDGDKALELVRRGDLSGMSFAYTTNEDDTENCVSMEATGEKTEDGYEIYLRHVKKILNIYDVTIAASPAYEQTEIQAREKQVEDFVTASKKAGIKNDSGDDARRERERKAREESDMKIERDAKHLRKIASAVLS